MADDAVGITESRLFGGRVVLRQPSRGHRAGTDAVLVAAGAGAVPGDDVVDAGSGVGTIGLAIALTEPASRVRLVEANPFLAGLARENVVLNSLSGRATVEERDLLAPTGQPPVATLAVSNPPFHAAGTTRLPDHALKQDAHVLSVDHGDWLRGLIRLLQPHGRLVIVHRPEALPALLAAADGRIGGVRVKPVLARAEGPAIRILLGGIVGSRSPLAILAPLVLHGDDGSFTPTAAAIHEGRGFVALLDSPTRKSRRPAPAFDGIALR